jgi:pimeloyl-ACP methyl ester carboxylesterase
MAATQGPTSINAFTQKISIAAWKTKPSWYVVAQNDRMIAPAFEVAMAKTIKAKSITLPSSHVTMLSHPDEVAVLIAEAAEALKAR